MMCMCARKYRRKRGDEGEAGGESRDARCKQAEAGEKVLHYHVSPPKDAAAPPEPEVPKALCAKATENGLLRGAEAPIDN